MRTSLHMHAMKPLVEGAGLPDGLCSCQKYQFGYILEGLVKENVDHLVQFITIGYILSPFGIFYHHSVYFITFGIFYLLIFIQFDIFYNHLIYFITNWYIL
jgi:hypothetical protein